MPSRDRKLGSSPSWCGAFLRAIAVAHVGAVSASSIQQGSAAIKAVPQTLNACQFEMGSLVVIGTPLRQSSLQRASHLAFREPEKIGTLFLSLWRPVRSTSPLPGDPRLIPPRAVSTASRTRSRSPCRPPRDGKHSSNVSHLNPTSASPATNGSHDRSRHSSRFRISGTQEFAVNSGRVSGSPIDGPLTPFITLFQ